MPVSASRTATDASSRRTTAEGSVSASFGNGSQTKSPGMWPFATQSIDDLTATARTFAGV